MEVERLFRVLLLLHREHNDFLLAQDAYITLSYCIQVLNNIDKDIEMLRKFIEEHGSFEQQRIKMQVLSSLIHFRSTTAPAVIESITQLLPIAECVWFCAPIDRVATNNILHLRRWRIHRNGAVEDDQIVIFLRELRQKCLDIVQAVFPDLLGATIAEESKLQSAELLPLTRDTRFMNVLPVGVVKGIRNAISIFTCSIEIDSLHYSVIDPEFAHLLGFSLARMTAFPRIFFEHADTSAILDVYFPMYYHSAFDTTVCVRWHLSDNTEPGTIFGFGIDVTNEIDATRTKREENVQKALRQWLHSFRNASFEQQASDILETVLSLREDADPDQHIAEFSSAIDSLKILVSSANNCVTLIDQALQVKDDVKPLSLSRLITMMSQFPQSYAESKGFGLIFVKVVAKYNDVERTVHELDSVIVRCNAENILKLMHSLLAHFVT